MEHQLRRYALGGAGAGFVLVWMTLGVTAAVLAALGAAAAMQLDRAAGYARASRRRRPELRRPGNRSRRPRDEDEEWELVPDEPSLIISSTGL